MPVQRRLGAINEGRRNIRPRCNKVLMLIFGGPALLAWFDPVRPYLAVAGVIIMSFAAMRALRAYRDFRMSAGGTVNASSTSFGSNK